MEFPTAGLLGKISPLTPQGNALDAIIPIMSEGAGLVEVLLQIAMILAVQVVLYFFALWRLRFK